MVGSKTPATQVNALSIYADSLSPVFKDACEGGLKTFVYKGTNGRWRDILTSEDLEKYDNVVNANLTPDCAQWHATGAMPD